jgi:rubrerythrin
VPLLKAADVLELAMGLEQSGEVFYRAVAEKTTMPQVKTLFSDLAEQEVLHYAAFAKLSKALRNRPLLLPDEWDQYQDYLQATVQSAFFEGPDKALAAAKRVQSEKEALGMAMGFEKETMLFFHDLRDMASVADQEVITRIIEEEKRHLRRLAGLL